MSSLAATQADGYYLPPEYYESGAYRKQGKNEWYRKNNSNSNNNNGKNKNHPPSSQQQQQQQVVRFELVDPCVCEKCQHRIGKGTRFNASKKRIGLYLDQANCPIYEFSTSCRNCSHAFTIRTDPANRGFTYGPGIRKQVRDWDAAAVQGIVRNEIGKGPLEQEEQQPDSTTTSIASLERSQLQRHDRETEWERLQQLEQLNRAAYQHDADRNAQLRNVARTHRHQRQRAQRRARALGWRSDMTLLSGSEATLSAHDRCQVAETTFGPTATQQEQTQWRRLLRQSPFDRAVVTSKPKKPTKVALATDDDGDCNHVVADPVTSSSSSREPHRIRRKRRKISTVDLTTTKETRTTTVPSTSSTADSTTAEPDNNSSNNNNPKRRPNEAASTTAATSAQPVSLRITTTSAGSGALNGLLSGYGSSDEESG